MRAMAEVVRFFSWPWILLPEGAGVALGLFDVMHGLEEHAAGTTGRIVDGLAFFRVQDVDH